jgi:galactokinase
MPAPQPSAVARATAAYRARYGAAPTLVISAPGRVNLIGEHTDYNDGFVLPMALPFSIAIAGEPRADGQVIAHSEGFAPVSFVMTDAPDPSRGWQAYVHGTADMLACSGHRIAGWQAAIASDIPTGASLSSSAALEVASGLAFVTAAGATIDRIELARIGQRVENDVMGLPSGIMDQLASAVSREGSAALIDCRDLSIVEARLPAGVDVVIMDTGTRRRLVDSAYAERRHDCEVACRALGVASLRDATLDRLDRIVDERVRRRARHVITENARTLATVEAMKAGAATEVGRLIDASHTSLRDDFEVSGPALDAIVELARSAPGCHGARMTGGGFAGCAVALVERAESDRFVADVTARFAAPAAQPATEPVRLYVVTPAAGAQVIARP